jgi:hypothetical protein
MLNSVRQTSNASSPIMDLDRTSKRFAFKSVNIILTVFQISV